jgi:DNA-binding protein HU-beta
MTSAQRLACGQLSFGFGHRDSGNQAGAHPGHDGAEIEVPVGTKCSTSAKKMRRALELERLSCHKTGLEMTKTELQIALAAATQTDKKTAGLFLDTLSSLAYKAIKKEGEFVLPGFGKLVKQKRKARTGVNPKTQQKIKIPAKTVVKFRVAKAAKDAILGVKK